MSFFVIQIEQQTREKVRGGPSAVFFNSYQCQRDILKMRSILGLILGNRKKCTGNFGSTTFWVKKGQKRAEKRLKTAKKSKKRIKTYFINKFGILVGNKVGGSGSFFYQFAEKSHLGIFVYLGDTV